MSATNSILSQSTEPQNTIVFVPGGHGCRSPSPPQQIDQIAQEALSEVQVRAASYQSNQEGGGFFSRLRFLRGQSSAQSAGAQNAIVDSSGEDAGASEPSIFSKIWSAVKNFFSPSSSSAAQVAEDSSAGPRSSSTSHQSGPRSSVASSDPRKKNNEEIEAYNDALEAAIADIKDPNKSLPDNANHYLEKVPVIYIEEAGRVIDEALAAAKGVRSKSLSELELINELDNVGNSLKTRKKPTDGWFSNKVFDITKFVGDVASCDVRGFFIRKYTKMNTKYQLNDSWDRAGVFKKIAKLALYDFPGSQKLKNLNAIIHDTSRSSLVRGCAFIAAIAALAIPVISFAARTVVLVLAITCQALVYRKIIPTLAVLGGTIAALVFGGKAAVFAGTIATIAFACSMTGFGSSLVSLAIAAVAYIKLKREKQNTDSDPTQTLQYKELLEENRQLRADKARREAADEAARAGLRALEADEGAGAHAVAVAHAGGDA